MLYVCKQMIQKICYHRTLTIFIIHTIYIIDIPSFLCPSLIPLWDRPCAFYGIFSQPTQPCCNSRNAVCAVAETVFVRTAKNENNNITMQKIKSSFCHLNIFLSDRDSVNGGYLLYEGLISDPNYCSLKGRIIYWIVFIFGSLHTSCACNNKGALYATLL